MLVREKCRDVQRADLQGIGLTLNLPLTPMSCNLDVSSYAQSQDPKGFAPLLEWQNRRIWKWGPGLGLGKGRRFFCLGASAIVRFSASKESDQVTCHFVAQKLILTT